MAGDQGESSYDMTDLTDLEDGSSRLSTWVTTGRGNKGVRNEGSESEEQYKVTVRFEGEGGVKSVDPIKLTKIIKNHEGDV